MSRDRPSSTWNDDDKREAEIRATIGPPPVEIDIEGETVRGRVRFLLRRLDEVRIEYDLAVISHQQTEESLTARFEARQTELLEANTREVERRRQAEAERDKARRDRNPHELCEVLETTEALRRFERARIAYLETEVAWLRRLLRWARARLSQVVYQTRLDDYLALGPSDHGCFASCPSPRAREVHALDSPKIKTRNAMAGKES